MAAVAVTATLALPVLGGAPAAEAVATSTTMGGRAAAVWQPAEDTDWSGTRQAAEDLEPQADGYRHNRMERRYPTGGQPGPLRHRRHREPASTVAALHSTGDHVVCYIRSAPRELLHARSRRASPSPTTTSSNRLVTSATRSRAIRSISSTSTLPLRCRSSRP